MVLGHEVFEFLDGFGSVGMVLVVDAFQTLADMSFNGHGDRSS